MLSLVLLFIASLAYDDCVCDSLVTTDASVGDELCETDGSCESVSEDTCTASSGTWCVYDGWTVEVEVEIFSTDYEDDTASWLVHCTDAVSGFGDVECESIEQQDDYFAILKLIGTYADVESAVADMEDNGVTIDGTTYQVYVVETTTHEEDGENHKLSLIVTLAIFAFTMLLIIIFFWYWEWPNSPEKIAARQAERERLEKEEEARNHVAWHKKERFGQDESNYSSSAV